MPTITTPKMTAEEFAEWSGRPENQHRNCELDRGVVVEMSRPGEEHGLLAWWVAHLLTNYVLKRGQGSIATNDTGLVVAADTVLGPDIMVFSETITRAGASRHHSSRIPTLCVEVRSPSDQMSKVVRKAGQYLTRGVPLVWVIDPELNCVQVYRRDEFAKVLDETETLTGNGILPDFSCPVADLFRLPGTTS